MLLRGEEDLMLRFPPFLLILHAALTYLRLSSCFSVNLYHGHFKRNSTEDLQGRTGAT